MNTTLEYINQLEKDKQNLNTMLNNMGVETTGKETFTELTPLVGKIVTDPILQDKAVEITENGTQIIKPDNGYNGLKQIQIITNVETTIGKQKFTIEEFIQAGSTYGTDGETMNCTSNVSTGFNAVYLKEVTDGTYYITTTTTKGTKNNGGFWYVYRYDGNYFYVVNCKEKAAYRLNTSGSIYGYGIGGDGTSFARAITYDEVLKVVVSGNMQKIYINDIEVARFNNANTIGAGHEGSSTDGTNFVVFKDLYKEVEPTSNGKYAPRHIRFTQYSGTELDEEIANLDTSNLTYMNTMFQQCTNLTSLDLSGFDTSNVTNMQNMFYLSSKIASLNVSNFNTSKVTNMYQMFARCSSLTSLDLSSFETSKVNNMQAIFDGCSSLQKLDIRTFDFSLVSSYGNMFNSVPAGCEIIVKDDGARDWVLARRSDLTNVKTVAELG